MFITNENQILIQSIESKEKIFKILENILVNQNLAKPGIAAVFEKCDHQFPCLFESIAVPHIPLEDESFLIQQGGIAILRLNKPILWNEVAISLVIALAIPKKQQPAVFAKIVALSNDKKRMLALEEAVLPSDIMSLLNAPLNTDYSIKEQDNNNHNKYDYQQDVIIVDENGIHARPATKLVNIANRYKSQLFIIHNNQIANLRSVGSIMGLAIKKDDQITLAGNGIDIRDAIAELVSEIKKGLDPKDQLKNAIHSLSETQKLPSFTHSADAIKGIPASPGIGIGPLFHLPETDSQFIITQTFESVEKEKEKLQNALAETAIQLDQLANEMKSNGYTDSAEIFLAHKAIVMDMDLIKIAEENIQNNQLNASQAWDYACENVAQKLSQSKDLRIAGRAIDYKDVAKRTLMILNPDQNQKTTIQWPNQPFIVISQNLTPTQTAQLPKDKVAGIITIEGGPTSHTAILARSWAIPAVVAAPVSVLQIPQHQNIILNGVSGFIEIKPDESTLKKAHETQSLLLDRFKAFTKSKFEKAQTTDGIEYEIAANIATLEDAKDAIQSGADGIGLMRTEILVQTCKTPPSEEWLISKFAEIANVLQNRPVLIRTYDIGGDKPVPFMNISKEDNPFLGIRGIRLCFVYPEIFKTQIRAILRSIQQHHLNAKIMLPMITSLQELIEAKQIIAHEAELLQIKTPPVGIMIEVPSVIWTIDQFVKEADFFSIGTNDLTQYILAMDRLHPKLASQSDSLHPAVLRAIAHAIKVANENHVWIGVCGNLASDSIGAAILAGLGIKELSVGAPIIASTKNLIQQSSYKNLQMIAQKALNCSSAQEIRDLFL